VRERETYKKAGAENLPGVWPPRKIVRGVGRVGFATH